MAKSVETKFETGRFIKFPNVPSFVSSETLLEDYHLHTNEDFGIVVEKQAEVNRNAIEERDGVVVSEYKVSETMRLRLETIISFKTVATIVDVDGRLVTNSY